MISAILRSFITVKNISRAILAVGLFLTTVSTVLAQNLTPVIMIQPDSRIEVGEEVFFSATGTTYKDETILRKARYEWDFGDGYYFRFDPNVKTITHSGIAVTHYFMKPGDFTVKLTVSIWEQFDAAGTPIGNPVATNTATCPVHVTGEAPITGFEIQRAPFQNRLAQYLYVQIPSAYRRNQTSLRVTLKGVKGSSSILFSKGNLSCEEQIFLDHKSLIQDDYVVIAELMDASGSRITGGLWRDKFTKKYSGAPKVGIDENNAFRLNGKLSFPIGPYMTNERAIIDFIDQASINMLHTEGYYTSHTPSTWSRYLEQAESNNVVAIGPGRGDYSIDVNPNRWQFNHNPDRISQYVKLNKDKPAMFAWIWQDEPNMGGRAQKVYPPTLAAWTYVCHREDTQHPAYNLFYGADWSRYYGTKLTSYDYLASAPFFGGKKWMQDVFSFDIYPIPFRLHPSLNFVDMGPYAAYLDALDRIHSNNKNLVPVIPAINPGQRNPGEKVLLHSAEQVYAEAWMNVVHGAKGILWFPHFDPTTIRWKAMKKFADQMKVLAPVVLSSSPGQTITDDANSPLRRVDTLVREKESTIYVFAVRVTEPDPIAGSKYPGVEPESITVSFTVGGLNGNTVADVVDEDRVVSLLNGKFTDTFMKNAVHIYKISLAKRPSH